MRDLIVDDLIRTCQHFDYPIKKDPYWLNIIGIRAADNTPNVFNDSIIFLQYLPTHDSYFLITAKATTDPGTYYLENPLNEKGTLVLAPGFYKDIWAIDKHQGKYDAYCQRLGPVTVYRDNDLDDVAEKTQFTESGFFGCNLHRASRWNVVNQINKFSAGCQVIQDPAVFEAALKLGRKQIEVHKKNAFSYILLEEEQIL